jgi:hypothetical protein
MKISTKQWLAGVAIATTTCVGFAQSPNDPNVTVPEGPKEASMPAEGAMLDRTTVRTDMGRTCSGLSDRQTEHACKAGFPTHHADSANTASADLGGKTDDQAN